MTQEQANRAAAYCAEAEAKIAEAQQFISAMNARTLQICAETDAFIKRLTIARSRMEARQ